MFFRDTTLQFAEFIALTDTYTTIRSCNVPSLEGYGVYTRNSAHGIIVFVKPNLCASRLHDIELRDLECLILQVSLVRRLVNVMVCYKPPKMSPLLFRERLSNQREFLPKLPTVIIGDFNEDILQRH